MLQIILLAAGIIIFTLSFIIPTTRKEATDEIKDMARDEVRKLVSKEMDQIRQQVDTTVDDAVDYAKEKTERSLERLSNEKIMAVNEYSDTVMQEIHKNHEEVMFLYDMLNDKQDSINKTAKEVTETTKTAQETARKLKDLSEVYDARDNISGLGGFEPDTSVIDAIDRAEAEVEPKFEAESEAVTEERIESEAKLETESETKSGDNQEILRLYKEGKTAVDIARELGRGVGEVSLVINLYSH